MMEFQQKLAMDNPIYSHMGSDHPHQIDQIDPTNAINKNLQSVLNSPIKNKLKTRLSRRNGLRCSYCCAGFTAILLAIGVMDLRAMAGITAAISLERISPSGVRMARAIGGVGVAAGLFMIVGAGAAH